MLKNNYARNATTVLNKTEKRAGETSMSVIRDGVINLEKAYKGDVENGIILLGQSCGLVEEIESVSDIINSIVGSAEKCLKSAYCMVN